MTYEANHSRVAPLDRAEEEGGSPETPEADAAEQRASAGGDNDDDWQSGVSLGAGSEVPEADAVEQAREVHEDEDDYR
ncbi:hypothetical protein [Actinorugispora endophytica]|uniref:DUF5709 domain-containing protein n=1 Tax=Actinorugispora endophytica TaxID=1605990 RepID=A0A4R6V399_9ACTN|nr:hypothetical protein [Actinorugispora endophytica]TDQ54731.1 hypothetical protein EV190_10147 [Actinorugispora endophytica]